MLGDLLFIVVCFSWFVLLAGALIGLDFLYYAITGKSMLFAIEKYLFDKFGHY